MCTELRTRRPGRLGMVALTFTMLLAFTACDGGTVEISVDGGETAEIEAEGLVVGLFTGSSRRSPAPRPSSMRTSTRMQTTPGMAMPSALRLGWS